MKIKSRSLSNSDNQVTSHMQNQMQDKIAHFLERKFRASRSFSTKKAYTYSLHRFEEFLSLKYNMELNELFLQFEKKQQEPLDVLDEYYTFLSQNAPKRGNKTYSSATISQYVITAKEFLNNEGCKIYNEDPLGLFT